MNTHTTQGEIRPSTPAGDPFRDPYAELYTIPLLRLRSYDRPVIRPEDCLVPGCLICAWRRAGLLDLPYDAPNGPYEARSRIVRDSGFDSWLCPSSYCPGCNAVQCVCAQVDDEAAADEAHTLGYEHGLADGPENRPTRRWLLDAGLDPEPYLAGYDDACASLSWPVEALSAPDDRRLD